MNENVTLVLHGFLNLPNLDKLQLVEAINDYFDSNDRDPIRNENRLRFKEINLEAADFVCQCCGR